MILDGVDYPRLRRSGRRFYYDHGGKPRHWEPLGADVARVLKRYHEIHDASPPGRGTIKEMLGDLVADLERRQGDDKLAPGTLANYRIYRKHLEAVFEYPEDVTQADVLRYLNRCPRMTFKNEIGVLSLGYVLWMEQGRLTFNPCFGVTTKRKTSRRDRIFTPGELDAIIGKADERLAVAIELAYATGLRIGDCCKLRWSDVQSVFALQKTGAPTALEQADALTAILARARALQTRVASLYVLCTRRGSLWSTGTLRDHWDAACAAAGVENAHFHDIRATAITTVERLHGQEAAREFAGHKDIRTTIIYLRDKRPNVVKPLARQRV